MPGRFDDRGGGGGRQKGGVPIRFPGGLIRGEK